jgi:hypothetical protein
MRVEPVTGLPSDSILPTPTCKYWTWLKGTNIIAYYKIELIKTITFFMGQAVESVHTIDFRLEAMRAESVTGLPSK